MINTAKINATLARAKDQTVKAYPDQYQEVLADIFSHLLLDALLAARMPIDEIISKESPRVLKHLEKTQLVNEFENPVLTVVNNSWLPLIRKLKHKNDAMQRVLADKGASYYPVDSLEFRQ